jgi:hypothetical protein
MLGGSHFWDEISNPGSLTSRGLKNRWSRAFQKLETSSELSYYSEILKVRP